jgi:hypothetical protein
MSSYMYQGGDPSLPGTLLFRYSNVQLSVGQNTPMVNSVAVNLAKRLSSFDPRIV